MAAFSTRAQMIERYDARVLGDLVADDGNRVSSANLLTDANLAAVLDDASGEIEAALLMGGRYTTAQLAALTGNSAKHLVRICCDIAMALLYGRRFMPAYVDQRKNAEETAERHLQRLAKGETIFDVEGLVDAANPTVDGPSTVEVTNLNLIRDRTRRYYSARIMPHGR